MGIRNVYRKHALRKALGNTGLRLKGGVIFNESNLNIGRLKQDDGYYFFMPYEDGQHPESHRKAAAVFEYLVGAWRLIDGAPDSRTYSFLDRKTAERTEAK